MKTLSGTFTFKLTVLIAVAVLTVLTIRVFASSPRPAPSDKRLTLKLKDAELKDNTGDTFKRAMKAVKGDQYSVRIKHQEGGTMEEVVPDSGASIKLDKVMKSELAKSSDEEFTAIGVHVTQTVTANTAAEIQKVLETLK